MNKWLKTSLSIILIIIGIVLYARFIGTMGFDTKEYTVTTYKKSEVSEIENSDAILYHPLEILKYI